MPTHVVVPHHLSCGADAHEPEDAEQAEEHGARRHDDAVLAGAVLAERVAIVVGDQASFDVLPDAKGEDGGQSSGGKAPYR